MQRLVRSYVSHTQTSEIFTASLALAVGATLVIMDELTLASMIAAALLMSRCVMPIDQVVGAFTKFQLLGRLFYV